VVLVADLATRLSWYTFRFAGWFVALVVFSVSCFSLDYMAGLLDGDGARTTVQFWMVVYCMLTGVYAALEVTRKFWHHHAEF
jgi:hypothetical protein